MKKVILDKKGRVAIVTINRPEKRNALDHEVRSGFFTILKEIEENHDYRAGIITGAGDVFVAGADISAMKDYGPEDAEKGSRQGSDIFLFLENMRILFIAAVNGWALGGGCELALACDIRICSEDAMFGQPEVKIGIIPGYGANVRLARLIGTGRAKEMIYSGRIIDATEAERIGLVNSVVPKAGLMKEAMKLASKFAEGPAAISYAKKAVNMAFNLDIKEALEWSSRLYGQVYKTRDSKEGISAYLEKRKPEFRGE